MGGSVRWRPRGPQKNHVTLEPFPKGAATPQIMLQRTSLIVADTVAKVPKTWTVILSAETYTSESRY